MFKAARADWVHVAEAQVPKPNWGIVWPVLRGRVEVMEGLDMTVKLLRCWIRLESALWESNIYSKGEESRVSETSYVVLSMSASGTILGDVVEISCSFMSWVL